MKIIIVGIGKVGRTLTEFLSQEGNDITVIDTDSRLIEEIVSIYDVKGINGNGASYDILLEAEADKADVLIAATPTDELNILSCLVAKQIGINHTIARVRNPEYSKQVGFMRNELGLSMTVNPEFEAANEISRILRFPSAIKIETFANDRVEIVELKLPEHSQLIGKPIYELRNELQVRFLICAVEREGKVFIPGGKFILSEKDNIYITASKSEIAALFRKLGIFKLRAKTVMIIGGGKISFYLAKQLLDTNVKVKIIEMDEKRCRELSELLPDASIINGDGSDQELLYEEGIDSVDAVVTLTGLDEENIIISLFAEKIKVPKVITKVNRITFSEILETVGIGSVISPKAITANHILRYVRSIDNTLNSKVETLYKLVNNQVEAAEFYISKETSYTHKTFRELELKDNILIACIIRNNSIIIPTGDDFILPEDRVIVVTSDRYLTDFEDTLK